jgi:hypothetical protein
VGIGLSGCGEPRIVNISDAPVISAASSTTDDDVKQAIVHAGEGLGWTMRTEARYKLIGTLTVRDQTAIVAIDYNTKTYSINYRDSTNLGYVWKPFSDYGGTITNVSTSQGQIHKNYNDWIKKLDAAIRLEISNLR